MVPVISMVGRSNTGKTTLLQSMTAELVKRGHSVAVAKHARRGFDLDKAGKDSWKFAQAGARTVAVSSPERIAIFRSVKRDATLAELARLIGDDCDLIITEGFKHDRAVKIEVHLKGQELLCTPHELLAVITDEPLSMDVPQFGKDDVAGLADIIESNILSRAQKEHVDLVVNGRRVGLNPFVRDFMARTVRGMVASLKNVRQLTSIDIKIRTAKRPKKAA